MNLVICSFGHPVDWSLGESTNESINDEMTRWLCCRSAPADEPCRERLHRRVQRGFELIVELLLLDDSPEPRRVLAFDELVELDLEGAHVGNRHVVQVAIDAGVDQRDLPLDG